MPSTRLLGPHFVFWEFVGGGGRGSSCIAKVRVSNRTNWRRFYKARQKSSVTWKPAQRNKELPC